MHRPFSPLALLAAALLAGCSDTAPPRPDPLVATGIVAASPRQHGLRLNGIVAARIDSALAFRVPGQVQARLVLRGQRVRKGQPLLVLDDEDLSLAAAQATGEAEAAARAVVAAEAAATRAQADEARQRGLVAAGSLSAQAYDAVFAAAQAATADLAAARARATAAGAAARLAANQRRYATLVADADGIVADILVEPGQMVMAGQPAVRLARAGPREVVVTVPEMLRGALPARAMAMVPATGQTFPAVLRELASAADPLTRSFEARYALSGGDALLPGQTATLDLVEDRGDVAPLMVPLAALIDRGRGAAVWVVGKDRRLVRRAIATGDVIDNSVEVRRGLKAGERVVVAGAHLLSERQRVRIGSLPQ